jgi:hypothetical protein
VSLLQSQGHPQAHHYPLCVITREQDLVRRRINRQTVTQATVLQSAYLGAKSKKGLKAFEKLLKDLGDGKAS